MAGDRANSVEPDRTETLPNSRPHKIRKTAETHEAQARPYISALGQHPIQSQAQVEAQHQTQSQTQGTHEGKSNEHLREPILHESQGGKGNTDTDTATAATPEGRRDSIPSSENVLRVLLEDTTTKTILTPPNMDQKISYVLCL